MPKFDLIAAEREIRASLEAVNQQRRDQVVLGHIELDFANAMKAFDEARVQMILAGLKLENEGVDRNSVVSAAGQAVGSMWGNALHYALGARERTILNGWVRLGLASQIGDIAAGKTMDATLPRLPDPVDLETTVPKGSA